MRRRNSRAFLASCPRAPACPPLRARQRQQPQANMPVIGFLGGVIAYILLRDPSRGFRPGP